MTRPSISLAMIAKNERHNLPRLLASVDWCFDEIHITDTGSTDGTIEYLKSDEARALAGCPIFVHHFDWVHDFSAARNASFSHVKTDYVCWLDCDDELSDRAAFIHFRDKVMNTADYWLATYHYAFNADGQSVCSFSRERVIKMNKGFEWKYFVHEGCVPTAGPFRSQQVSSWAVNHRRTDVDTIADKSRNLNLFEEQSRTKGLCPRMTYYYGKELFDARKFMEAGVKLLEASKMEGLELHDRIMSIQYACGAALECGQYQTAIQIGLQGVNLMPSRAEFWALLADCHVRIGKLSDAAIFYQAARSCRPDTVNGFVAVSLDAYDRYPTEQLATIALNTGDMNKAETEISRLQLTNPVRAAQLLIDFNKIAAMTELNPGNAVQTDDIIITCPPSNGPKADWDDVMHEKVGLGGSETAAVELAEFWQKETGRQVVIFNSRMTTHTSKNGVSYRPVSQLPQYLSKSKPFIHIAWRHSTRLTNSPSYIWCHDLYTPGAERTDQYDKILCLSEFHKGYVKALQNIPDEKVMLMRNGIEPKHFRQVADKNANKVIFTSSPDRGLDRTIEIVRRARITTGRPLELHVFYGFENMRAMGMAPMADQLEALMKQYDWVKYHGNVKKDVLTKHFMESAVWVYPADFIETFCITALEAAAGGCYSIIRNFGGVVDTARQFSDKGMAEIVNSDAQTTEELDLWASRLSEAIVNEKWRNVSVDPEKLSWRAVADEWMEKLSLKKIPEEVRNFASSGYIGNEDLSKVQNAVQGCRDSLMAN